MPESSKFKPGVIIRIIFHLAASDKKEGKDYGILAVDYEISKADKLVVVSRINLYRIKK